MNFFTLRFDGSCGPKNPGGTAAFGFTLHHNGTLVKSGHGVIGTGPEYSNNYAEHYAVCQGMSAFLELYKGEEKASLNILGDSKLVIQQLNKKWRIRSGLYESQAHIALKLLKDIRNKGVNVHINWIPREANQKCDDLSKLHVQYT